MAIMTNGASIMKKDGRLLVANQKICFAHGLQLAVIDVIYKKRQFAKNQPEFKDEFSDSDSSENDKIEESQVHYRPVIKKIRKVIIIFRRSPTKNNILQKYIKAEFGKQLSLIMDCKTRRSSPLLMLKQFYKVKNCSKE